MLRAALIALFLGVPASSLADGVIALAPKPARCERHKGEFTLDSRTKVVVDPGSDAIRAVGQRLVEAVREKSGLALDLQAGQGNASGRRIVLTAAQTRKELGDEGYELSVAPASIILRAAKPAGLFYGVQTLRQMISRSDGSAAVGSARWGIPCATIEDRPRFAWRAMHLDVARHFFDKQFVKRYIDYIAAYKINVFHLYLTDDQGWRIEIKRYPRLTEVGAWRKGTRKHLADGAGDEQKYGGFYTQQDIREIVRYAQERFVTVVPGISMPGHSQAALAAYPELSSTGGPFEVWTDWGISKEVMDPGKEEVFRFVEGVLSETIGLFPGRYIHCGGDEVPRDRWKASPFAQARMRQEGLKNEDELQSYFTKRVERFLNSQGRQLIGWDEILEGGLAPNAVVMSWRGTSGGIAAARAAHQVVMVPHEQTYFNYMQHKAKRGPGHPGYLPLLAVYHFDPLRGLKPAEAKYVLGGQACLWTEYVPTSADVEYLLFPRLLAMAEVLWSPADRRDDREFLTRVPVLMETLDRAGVHGCREYAE